MTTVGCISVSSPDPRLAEKVSASLDQWLITHEWDKNILILKNSAISFADETQIEVVFSPGEYQSNGAKFFKFKTAPEMSELLGELKLWLYSIER